MTDFVTAVYVFIIFQLVSNLGLLTTLTIFEIIKTTIV